ncbi:hypothetical protein C8F04DRAFT_1183687 [Mycena alexandri]|uniref:Uncharacterized protein n=1 Tax=Mycena alexandri TaxID=1745969 RepID=A0AAD6X283_9AGAR|nr:hypothetical protein C8F04DRAFT_1183687 [Mycena alexandri]
MFWNCSHHRGESHLGVEILRAAVLTATLPVLELALTVLSALTHSKSKEIRRWICKTMLEIGLEKATGPVNLVPKFSVLLVSLLHDQDDAVIEEALMALSRFAETFQLVRTVVTAKALSRPCLGIASITQAEDPRKGLELIEIPGVA